MTELLLMVLLLLNVQPADSRRTLIPQLPFIGKHYHRGRMHNKCPFSSYRFRPEPVETKPCFRQSCALHAHM